MTTAQFILLWLLVLLAYEVWTLCNRRHNDTISHCVVGWCRRYRWLPLALLIFVVLLAGHWFLPYEIRWVWPQPFFVAE